MAAIATQYMNEARTYIQILEQCRSQFANDSRKLAEVDELIRRLTMVQTVLVPRNDPTTYYAAQQQADQMAKLRANFDMNPGMNVRQEAMAQGLNATAATMAVAGDAANKQTIEVKATMLQYFPEKLDIWRQARASNTRPSEILADITKTVTASNIQESLKVPVIDLIRQTVGVLQ
jgi:hypothetical protein